MGYNKDVVEGQVCLTQKEYDKLVEEYNSRISSFRALDKNNIDDESKKTIFDGIISPSDIDMRESLLFSIARANELAKSLNNCKIISEINEEDIFGPEDVARLVLKYSDGEVFEGLYSFGDPLENGEISCISLASPIGKALYGAKVNDNLNVTLPEGNVLISVLEIQKKGLKR